MSAYTGVPRGADHHRRQHRRLQVLTAASGITLLAALLTRHFTAALIVGILVLLLTSSWAHDHDYEEMDRQAEEWRAGY